MKTFIVDTSGQTKDRLIDLFETHYPLVIPYCFSSSTQFNGTSTLLSATDLIITENPDIIGLTGQAKIIYISDKGVREFPNTFDVHQQCILLKPINDDAFIATIKYHMACCLVNSNSSLVLRMPDLQGCVMVKIQEIIRCEGLQKCTRIVLNDRPHVISSYNIGEFRKILVPLNFLLVHKSHLVNSEHIYRFDNEGLLFLSDGSSVPVSRRRKSQLFPNYSSGPQLMTFCVGVDRPIIPNQ